MYKLASKIQWIKIHGKTIRFFSSQFTINKVLSKEYVIATLLFNVVLDIAITRSTVEIRGNIVDKFGQVMMTADEVVAWEEDCKIFKKYLLH